MVTTVKYFFNSIFFLFDKSKLLYMENFNLISNISKKDSGICYFIDTHINEKYTFIISAFMKTGTVANISKNDDIIYKIDKKFVIQLINFNGNDSKIKFSITFPDKNIRSVLKIYFVGVIDINNNNVSLGSLINLHKPKICYYENMNYWKIFTKIKQLNKNKYIAVENKNNFEEIFEIFDNDFGKILLKSDISVGDYVDNMFVFPLNLKQYYLNMFKSKIFFI